MLVHCFVYAFIWPYRISFEGTPSRMAVAFDFYNNVVYIVDILITFLTPIVDREGKIITDKKRIAKKYIKTYFFLDVIACFPFTYFRRHSNPDAGLDR